MSKKILGLSMMALFIAVGAGAASAASAPDDSWTVSANDTPSGASSVDTINTLVPDSYEFWKD